jgi:hypothetical protein
VALSPLDCRLKRTIYTVPILIVHRDLLLCRLPQQTTLKPQSSRSDVSREMGAGESAQVTQYPTFVLYPACEKERFAVYDGPLSTDPLLQWIAANAGVC